MMPYGTEHQPPDDWELPDNVRQLTRADRAGAQHRGQVRMAYRLADGYAGRLMHVYGLGWFCWDGTRWVEDQQGKAKRAVIQTLRTALAASLDDKELREDVRKCETAHGISGVLEIASALEPFAVTVDQLDADPHLINTVSGALDLTTGELHPHHPRFRCTKITRGAYQPDNPTDGPWHVFLRQALPDEDVRAYFQRVIGLSLLGAVREHILPIATGTGGNGKGVAYLSILHALGGYAYAAESDLFTAAKSNANAASPALMGLRGRRFVAVSETERDQPLAEALMKMITGGDPITARPLYGKPVTFEASWTPLLITNHLPRVSGDDEAIWRRLRVIPFDQSFRDRPDTGLGERLRGAADEVLSWAVAGWDDYRSRGLAEPDSVKVATRAYRTESDALARFISEMCVTGPHVHVGHSELLAAWRSWCAESGELSGTDRAFSKGIEERGYSHRKTMTGKRYQGLCLPADEAP